MTVKALISESLISAIKKSFTFIWVAIPRIVLSGLLYFVVILSIATLIEFFIVPGANQTEFVFLWSLSFLVAISIAALLTFILITPFALKIALSVHDGIKIGFFMPFFHNLLLCFSIIIAALISHIPVALLFFPGIYLHLRWIFSYCIIVDQAKGPFFGLAQSWRITRPIKRVIFYISLAITAIALGLALLWSKHLATLWKSLWMADYYALWAMKQKMFHFVFQLIKQYPFHTIIASLISLFLSVLFILFLVSLYRRLTTIYKMEQR